MRVGLVIERFAPRAGGAEEVAWNVARGLAARGDDVVVAARRAERAPGIAWRRVRVPSSWQPLRVLAFSQAAAAALAREGVDCVLSFARTRHQDVYRAGGGCHAEFLGRRAGAGRRWRRLSPRHAVLVALERRIAGDERQRVVCPSHGVRRELQRHYGVPDERLAVIHNGVDLERFHPRHRAGPGAALRADLSAGRARTWLFAGSGFARKGLDTALRAFARAEDGGAELWVAGRDAPGPWRRLARQLGVDGRVRFLGFRRDLEAVYAAADGLLLPSRYDAFGCALLEAAAAGLPIVTSGAAGAAEILRPVGGVVEDPEDVAGFAAALTALRDPGTRAERGRAARGIAEKLPWDACVTALRGELLRAAR